MFSVYVINCTVYTRIIVQWLVDGCLDQGQKGVCIGKKVHCGPMPYMLQFLHWLSYVSMGESQHFAPTSCTKQSHHYHWKVLRGTSQFWYICCPVGHVNFDTGFFLLLHSRPRIASCMRKASYGVCDTGLFYRS